MDLEEERVDAGTCGRAHEVLDVLAVAGRCRAIAARQLDAVRAVKDDRVAEAAHDRQAAHVDDEVVIAKGSTALRQEHLLAAALVQLVDDIAHVLRGEELALLDVDDAARLGSGVQKIRLPAEECRDLQDVGHLGDRLRLRRLVDIGHDGHAERLLDLLQHLEALLKTRAAEAVIRGAVCLIERSLEYVVDAETAADFLDRAPDQQAAVHALKDTGTCEQCEGLSLTDHEFSNLDLIHAFHLPLSILSLLYLYSTVIHKDSMRAVLIPASGGRSR